MGSNYNSTANDDNSGTDTDIHVENTDIHIDLGITHKKKLNKLAVNHYGGNRTNCTRRAIDRLETWHGDGEREQQRILDSQQKQLVELTELVQELHETFTDQLRQPQHTSGRSADPIGGTAKKTRAAANDVYAELQDASEPISEEVIIARTDLQPMAVGEGLGYLHEKGWIAEQEESEDKTQYRITSMDER